MGEKDTPAGMEKRRMVVTEAPSQPIKGNGRCDTHLVACRSFQRVRQDGGRGAADSNRPEQRAHGPEEVKRQVRAAPSPTTRTVYRGAPRCAQPYRARCLAFPPRSALGLQRGGLAACRNLCCPPFTQPGALQLC